MSPGTLVSTGIILLSVVAIASGGVFLLRVTAGSVPVNQLQRTYYRAGHAHAGVLVILGLVVRIIVQDPSVPAWTVNAADGVLYAAILMPAGFFFSVMGKDPARPNGWRALIWMGAATLTVGLVVTGAGLIVAGASGG